MTIAQKNALKYGAVVLGVLILLVVCIFAYRMIVFQQVLGRKFLDELRIESPDGNYTLVINEWEAAGGAGADIYQQKGDKKTKLGETASESGFYPFRDRLFETEWGDGWVNIRYFGGGEIWRECRFELS